MPDKRVAVILELKDKFSKAVKNATGSFSKLRKTILSFKGILAGAGFYALYRQIKSITEAANRQEIADTQLAAALRSVGLESQSTYEYLKQLADELQRTTSVGNETIEAIEALFLRYKVSPALMKPMIQATLDYARAIGKDVRTAALDMAKAAQGNLMMLQRYGVQIDKTRFEMEGLSALITEVGKKFGGAEAAYVETFAGKTAQLRNVIGDLKEQLGFTITKSTAWKAALASLTDAVIEMQEQVKEGKGGWVTLSDAIADLINTVSKGLPDVANIIGQFVNFANASFKILGTTIGGLAAALVNLFQGKFKAAWEAAKGILPEVKAQVDGLDASIEKHNEIIKTAVENQTKFNEALAEVPVVVPEVETHLNHLKADMDELWKLEDTDRFFANMEEQAYRMVDIYDYTAGEIARTFSDLFMGIEKSWSKALRRMMSDLAAWILEATAKAAVLKYIFGLPAGGVGGAMLGFLGLREGGAARGVKPLPGFQEGGVVTRPTLALVGEGGEKEYIIPESKFPKPEVFVTIHNANPDTYAEVLVKMGNSAWDKVVREAIEPALERGKV